MKEINGVVIVAGDGIAHQGKVTIKKSEKIPRGGIIASLVRTGKKHIYRGFLYIKKKSVLIVLPKRKHKRHKDIGKTSGRPGIVYDRASL